MGPFDRLLVGIGAAWVVLWAVVWAAATFLARRWEATERLDYSRGGHRLMRQTLPLAERPPVSAPRPERRP